MAEGGGVRARIVHVEMEFYLLRLLEFDDFYGDD